MSQFHNLIFALKIASDEEDFISMGTFCHCWLERKVITSTEKTLWLWIFRTKQANIVNVIFFLGVRMSVINSGNSPFNYL